MNTIEEIDLLFKSGNDVPVTRATITLEQWEAVKANMEMTEELKEAIKQFIKDNLVIEAEYANKYSPGENQEVSLKFKGDDDPFSFGTIYIQESESWK